MKPGKITDKLESPSRGRTDHFSNIFFSWPCT